MLRATPFLLVLLLTLAACDDVLDRVAPLKPTPASVELSLTIAEPPADLPPYDRDDWRLWTDDDSDCQDTRQEVLIAESASRVKYGDDRGCRVESGHWFDPYTGRVHRDPSTLHIDHLVPLANAHRSGGWAWSSDRKRQFANSLGDAAHLIAVSADANREKGARGPEEWRPSRMEYWCAYATAWARVKRTWALTVTHAEAVALREMLQTCDGPVSFEATGGMPLASTAEPVSLPTPLPAGTYASCAEAAASGEPRVKGARGDGWGFPAALLPNSRDGDGDGVVCEVALPASEQPTPAPVAPSAALTLSATPESRPLYASCAEAEAAGEERIQGGQGTGWGFPIRLVLTAQDRDKDGVVCEIADPSGSQPQTYASCADADAGEEGRIQGESGNGLGFPAAMVPSAQDGDGDGVVCETQGGLAITFASPTAVPPTPTPAPTPTPTVAPDGRHTYASCDDAEAAGEPRVQGSNGPGRGFPAELVPSARDGDGDGVVCER
ncbi:MAG: DUF1524 domain-containing protein [Chloroflexota bacterium]|nr:DUF1524 domain-containing protein [Chloroflexota bacterium]MDE2968811.1 DUF1524 domain-containing protein [Chloroflexota bacterium]